MSVPRTRTPWGKISLATFGLIGTGWLLMKVVVPTPEQTYNSLAPDLKRQADAIRAARLARENASNPQLQSQLTNPDADKPVWAGEK
ncbi:hypothetical protein SISNIDRAFT_6166 [Sistotremastrum niveocremeum HHB9708]|uniref:Cytochrome b mRNA-processing protein 4 n=2 Tax=Sistotremastraceae TaxID=3402574 RepID=A0A165AGP2_9AGAM|nr:hypothetical protein SISNIDRAFT_6166 [Sistotremastrum niveocremeum HHB9708]KZT44147.1 hypothetical protein SISSUDRAFT_338549 [Sistotremastrum suecicum HHB10207 ss-3]